MKEEDHKHISVPHFMLIPSLSCPASCSYCFGPHHGPVMSLQTLDTALDYMGWLTAQDGRQKVRITFHGGEPLVAGYDFMRRALEGVHSLASGRKRKIAVQSNLWLLDDQFCRVFSKHRVEIGTSLDGPEEITDAQRGLGYFSKTMAGIARAQTYGMSVGCIATFTSYNLPRWREVFDFFLDRRLGFSIHAAVPPLEEHDLLEKLTPAQYGRLLCDMLEAYITHRCELSISTLDQICQGFGGNEGKVCTFWDCLGMFLAIDPRGDIFACQRFAGQREYRLGTLAERPSLAQLYSGPAAQRFSMREHQVREACGGCEHLPYCKGGCPYNAWAGGNGRIKDPYCEAYREVFDYIGKCLMQELTAEENIAAIAERPWDGRGHPLMRKGPLIELVREGPHPSRTARTAKRLVAAVELARVPDIPTVAERLVRMGVCRSQESGEASLRGLQKSLRPRPGVLHKLYLHLTFACQLHCSHCYARADAHGDDKGELPVAAVEKLVSEAKTLGFREVVFTGGEPLLHPSRVELLESLSACRARTAPMKLILRTNFAMQLSDDELRRVSLAFDRVVVSIDGDERTHDERRGKGAYVAAVRNLERYQILLGSGDLPGLSSADVIPARLSLACTTRSSEVNGPTGLAVRELADRLGLRRPRFRPLLPLGRAADWDEPPTSEALDAHADPMELIENGFHPVASCGIGQNLYVEPSGEAFPCYAYHRPDAYLGNVIDTDLGAITSSSRFRDLASHTVDSNLRCRACEVRYLCGGACRAWGGESAQQDLDAPPRECSGLKARALGLHKAALSYLGIGEEMVTILAAAPAVQPRGEKYK